MTTSSGASNGSGSKATASSAVPWPSLHRCPVVVSARPARRSLGDAPLRGTRGADRPSAWLEMNPYGAETSQARDGEPLAFYEPGECAWSIVDVAVNPGRSARCSGGRGARTGGGGASERGRGRSPGSGTGGDRDRGHGVLQADRARHAAGDGHPDGERGPGCGTVVSRSCRTRRLARFGRRNARRGASAAGP